MPNYIYALLCPLGQVRYIGKSNNPEFRFRKHISAAKNHKTNYYSAHWIRSVLRTGKIPALEILTEVPVGREWEEYETYFIKLFRDLGCNLTNTQPGGEGSFDTSPKAVALRVAKASITKSTPEYKEKASKISSALWADPEIKAKRLAAMAEARLREGYSERLSAAQLISCARPEVKARRSKSIKASFADGSREITIMRPEIKAKREAGMKARWTKDAEKEKHALFMRDPDRQARMQAAANSPDAKAKRAAKMASIQSDPDYLAKQSAKTKANWENPEFRAKMAARQQALYERTHTPEHLAMMLDKRNERKRQKRASEDPAVREQRLAERRTARKLKALSQSAP